MSKSPDEIKRTWVLELADPAQLQPRELSAVEVELRRLDQPSPAFSWFLHQAVGTVHRWGGREQWGESEWTAFVERPEVETWVASWSAAPAGYFELERQEDGSVRIVHLGLLPEFTGRGLGGWLLTSAVRRAWELGDRVWLSTCSHDHPHALKNYLARGFQVIEERTGTPNRRRQAVVFTSGVTG